MKHSGIRIFNILSSLLILLLFVRKSKGFGTKEDLYKEKLWYGLFPNSCYDLLWNNSTEWICIQIFLMKVWSYIIIAMSALMRFPQIVKSIQKKTTKGLSQFSVFAELFGFSVNLFYNVHYGYPFTTYGNMIFLVLFTALLLIFIIIYDRQTYTFPIVLLLSIGLTLFYYLIGISTLLNDNLWQLLILTSFPAILVGRLSQVYKNYSNKGVGTLSLGMYGISSFVTTSKVITLSFEIKDMTLVGLYFIYATITLTITFQIIYYNKLNRKNKIKGE